MIKHPAHAVRLLAAAIVVLFALAHPNSPAAAAPAEQLAQGSPADIDPADMANFVAAAKAIVELRRAYEPRLQAATSQAAAQALIEEARGLMRTAITDTGMSVESYMAIAEAAQANPELRQRIESAVGVPGQ